MRVEDQSNQTGTPGRRPAAGRILAEALLIAVVGAGLAFAANQISPRGLALSRPVQPVANPVPSPATGTNSVPLSAADFLAEQMRKNGLQLIDGRQALQYFRDPRFQQGSVVFVDARNVEEYQLGHIPGAYEFYSIYPANYIATVLPVCSQAEQIVVYCNGGSCDESEDTALWLRDNAGIPNQKIFVFGGGITEWRTNGLPVETGERNSGILLKTNANSEASSRSNTNQ